MIDFLLGVPGKLKTISDWLTTHWTAARAAKLDYLTANVAVASTAVSNINYTSERAEYLDNLSAGATALQANPLLMPPIAANFPQNNNDYPDPAFFIGGAGIYKNLPCTQVPTESLTNVDAVNITGSGVLNLLVAATAGVFATSVKLTIDGVVLINDVAVAPNKGKVFIGAVTQNSATAGYGSVSLDQIPFRTSIRIEHKTTQAGAMSFLTYALRRTS